MMRSLSTELHDYGLKEVNAAIFNLSISLTGGKIKNKNKNKNKALPVKKKVKLL